MAALLADKDMHALRRLLGVTRPELTASEAAEQRAEELFAPTPPPEVPEAPAPPPLHRGLSATAAERAGLRAVAETYLGDCLARCDARTLRELKGVSRRWGARAVRCATQTFDSPRVRAKPRARSA